MYQKIIISFFITLIFSFFGNAQVCTLDVGGENSDTLTKVFQLNAAQISVMETLQAELRIENKVVEDEIQKLFDSHPQSTPEELTVLAEKYKVFKAKIIMASEATDTKLLALFNEKQYARYLELCYEAIREPIKITPVSFSETVVDPE